MDNLPKSIQPPFVSAHKFERGLSLSNQPTAFLACTRALRLRGGSCDSAEKAGNATSDARVDGFAEEPLDTALRRLQLSVWDELERNDGALAPIPEGDENYDESHSHSEEEVHSAEGRCSVAQAGEHPQATNPSSCPPSAAAVTAASSSDDIVVPPGADEDAVSDALAAAAAAAARGVIPTSCSGHEGVFILSSHNHNQKN